MIGFLINALAILINILIGMNFGFTPVAFFCIALNTVVGLWCLAIDSIY